MKIFFEDVNFTVRLIGSIIKLFIYLCIILIAAGAALFWFDTGSWLVLPLAQRAGNFFLAPMKLELENVNGSIHNGYSLDGLKLISGDEELFTLNHASISPDWNLVLLGMNGIPYIQNLDIQGVSSDLRKVLALVSHFTASSDNKPSEDDEEEPSSFTLNPFNVSIRDVNFGTDYANLSLDSMILNDDGRFMLNTKIISRDNILPLRTNARINFDPIEIISSDIFIGQKSTGSFSGKFSPIKARLDLTALSLDEFLKFAPPMDIKASGRIDGRIFLDTDNNNIINASGVVSMPRANIMDIPLNFRLPFRYNGNNFAALDNAVLNTELAALNLNASMDIDNMHITADGEAKNISLNEIGRVFAPQAGLKGAGGLLKFNVDTTISGDVPSILNGTKADINAVMPMIEAAGIRILRDMDAHVNLVPGDAPKISLGGELFKGKLFARGEALQDSKGNIKPQAVVSVVNLDLNAVARAIPSVRSVKPSGKLTASARIYDNLNIDGKITSDRLSAAGYTLTNLLANLNYDNRSGRAELEGFRTNLGKGQITASGNVNLKSNIFTMTAETKNFDTKAIPALKDLTGSFNLKASASGKYTDMNTLNANANLEARNVHYAGTPVGSISFPAEYSRSRLTIPKAIALIPGGIIELYGNADLHNASNPVLNLTASTNRINLANVLRDLQIDTSPMPVSGIIRGNVNIKGPLSKAGVNANIYADNVKAGDIIDIPSAALEADGNMKRIDIRRLDAKVNRADIHGNGRLDINQKNFAASSVNVGMNVRRLNLKQILSAAKVNVPVSGIINASARLNGTISKPALDINLNSLTYNNKTDIKDIALKLRSPSTGRYLINTSATINGFRPEADIDLAQTGNIWSYQLNTRPIDINAAIASQMPDMAGIVKGFAAVSVKGNTKENSPININASANEINIIDKIKIQDISLPVVYSTSANSITMKKGRASLSNGIITAGMNVDLKESSWNGNIDIDHLNFGKLAEPFLPEGELIGSVDAHISMNGDFGVMPLNFANGKFSTTPGYFHKMDILDTITPTGRITFDKIQGSFFWNGTELFFNPGTGARAGNNEPLYRYFNISGSAGMKEKGLNLVCDGRFDLKILDQLLGAMKGLFQYMTGTIAQSALRDAAGRVLGVKRRDYQNVSFTLANSWSALQLLDLKITKSIEDFLPINILNKDEEKQKEETQFKMSIKIPTGPGDKSIEDESPEDQLKQQFIDNLFNLGW